MKKYIIEPSFKVKDAVERMSKENIKAVLILDKNNRLIGLFSNGDMRKFFLAGGDLNANICDAMNPNPKVYRSKSEIIEERISIERVIYPIVDNNGVLIDVIDFNRNSISEKVSNILENIPLLIMAGGKGTRLYPYTKILPKPLIPIGDLTITERIIESFKRFGCKKVIMILNYKSSMIKAYMHDLTKDYSIDFIDEDKFLGTGGGIKLAKKFINSTFFLSNCDTLIRADFECAYKTHKKNHNLITFVCSMKDFVVPYGVVESTVDGKIIELKEKPEFSFLVNTGVYIIEPEVLDEIDEGEFIHLPDLAQRLVNKGKNVGVFPISEKEWLDMGQFAEMENMKKELGIN